MQTSPEMTYNVETFVNKFDHVINVVKVNPVSSFEQIW